MSGRMTLSLLGLSLLAGCGQSYEPTIRQIVYRPEDKPIATVDPAPVATSDLACPGAKAHPKIVTNAEGKSDPELAEERRTRLIKEAKATQLELEARKKAHADEAAPSATPAARAADLDLNSRDVRLDGSSLEAPRGWVREQSPIDLILAAFRLPRTPGDEDDAQVTVTAVAEKDPKKLQRCANCSTRRRKAVRSRI